MESGKSVDAFLDEVATFLDRTDAPEGARNHSHEAATTSVDDSLLLASHQLLAETEDLLASHKNSDYYQRQQDVRSASTNAKSSEDDRSESQCTDVLSAEKRREIRNALAAQRRVRYRQKLKDEKEVLKQQATELSAQLTSLETSQAERKAKHASNLMFGAWRAVAARQLERRMQAEQQQKLLRAEVVGRSRLIRRMSMLLDKLLEGSQRNRLVEWESIETDLESGGSPLFKTVLDDVDAAYLQINSVMNGLTFESATQTPYKLTRQRKKSAVYFDTMDRMVFPYKFEQAADVISTVMLTNPDEIVTVQDLKDTLTLKYHLKYQLSAEESASFRVYAAGKRYREKDRLVFVWRSMTEGLGQFEGLQSKETAWMVVRPSSEKTGRSCTILESSSRVEPIGFGSASGCDGKVDRFVDTLAKSGGEEFKLLIETMENLMI
ncbi:hypothetical protein F444_13445 [Phytophthora nicotianae P1976]|uniref:Uncharacterized protein n=3 Tax=Phytophthora nicotianae TaxID=4792 RepID=A0A080ZTU6_PHYNI|nr:hypothetical protein F444_13445 [Phytophthora nicotianae P1976]